MLLQGSIIAGLGAILVIEIVKKSTNSNQQNNRSSKNQNGGGDSPECAKWKSDKYEYDMCVSAGGGAVPCSYGVYGNNGGPPPRPKGCGCNKGK